MTQNAPRPDGQVIWFHVPRDSALPAIEHLIARMVLADHDLHFVVTTTSPALPPEQISRNCHYVSTPFDRRKTITDFLTHWRPNVAIWVRGNLNSFQVADIAARGMPLFLMDATVEGLKDFRGLVATWRAKAMMRRFDRCLAVDEDAANRLRSLGAQSWRVEVTGTLEEGTAALPHDEDDRRDLAEALATRPVWTAIHAPADEIGFLLDAHKEAVRKSHRFLLILRPTPDQDCAALIETAGKAGLSAALRSDVYIPGEDQQVLIADLPEERGLWYRVAPITYLGGTFAFTPPRNPFEAAALGSAIIHGPNISRFRSNFERLAEAHATVALTAPDHLGATLGDLTFPERAARLAHAAWDVTSSGAEVTDRIVALLQTALPQSKG